MKEEPEEIKAALRVIEAYYGEQKTIRTNVLYMNHIYEGLNLMKHLKFPISSQVVYILHPIFQNAESEIDAYLTLGGLVSSLKNDECVQRHFSKSEVSVEFIKGIDEAHLYKDYANAYLSKHHAEAMRLGKENEFKLDSTMPESVKHALIADKVQNRKDFELYHKALHPQSDVLDHYFKTWLTALDITENVYEEIVKECRKETIVVFTGAGISAESGINTFRDTDGTWENVSVMEVATPQGWKRNREKVLNFYNTRILQLDLVLPNKAHELLAQLEKRYDVTIVTQNVDDLHERGGSTNVIHLHGELRKKCSSLNKENHITTIEQGETIVLGSKCPDGSQWRPYIVWFGEMVPNMELVINKTINADIFIVIGTSLQVQPAASLAEIARGPKGFYQIDPNSENATSGAIFINKNAIAGMEELYSILN